MVRLLFLFHYQSEKFVCLSIRSSLTYTPYYHTCLYARLTVAFMLGHNCKRLHRFPLLQSLHSIP